MVELKKIVKGMMPYGIIYLRNQIKNRHNNELKAEQLKAEQLKVEQLKVEQLKVEQLKVEQLKVEQHRYQLQLDTFREFTAQFNVPKLNKFYWYHTVDLGNGIVTPGSYDYRDSLDVFGFPADMRNMRVLDIGSATGFFAFEFARRGAKVFSVELPSLSDWDMITGERQKVIEGLMVGHQALTPQEAYWCHLNGPFEFCRERLGLDITRIFSTIYNLSLDLFGGQQFDLVYLGDVLGHLFSPLAALNAVAPLCRDKLIIGSDLMEGNPDPVLRFIGQVENASDSRSWWTFTLPVLTDMLYRVGFQDVSVVGKYTAILRVEDWGWPQYKRIVLHAKK